MLSVVREYSFYRFQNIEIPDEEKLAQEKKSLRRIKDSFRKIIIQKRYMNPRTDDDGIIRMGIINFLLDETIV